MSDTLRSTMSWDLVFVGCGRAKRQHEARARDLYTGPVFRAHWAILQHLAIWASVLSAEHGVIEHGAEVEPYQREIGDGRHFIAGPVPLQTAREKKSGHRVHGRCRQHEEGGREVSGEHITLGMTFEGLQTLEANS